MCWFITLDKCSPEPGISKAKDRSLEPSLGLAMWVGGVLVLKPVPCFLGCTTRTSYQKPSGLGFGWHSVRACRQCNQRRNVLCCRLPFWWALLGPGRLFSKPPAVFSAPTMVLEGSSCSAFLSALSCVGLMKRYVCLVWVCISPLPSGVGYLPVPFSHLLNIVRETVIQTLPILETGLSSYWIVTVLYILSNIWIKHFFSYSVYSFHLNLLWNKSFFKILMNHNLLIFSFIFCENFCKLKISYFQTTLIWEVYAKLVHYCIKS